MCLRIWSFGPTVFIEMRLLHWQGTLLKHPQGVHLSHRQQERSQRGLYQVRRIVRGKVLNKLRNRVCQKWGRTYFDLQQSGQQNGQQVWRVGKEAGHGAETKTSHHRTIELQMLTLPLRKDIPLEYFFNSLDSNAPNAKEPFHAGVSSKLCTGYLIFH